MDRYKKIEISSKQMQNPCVNELEFLSHTPLSDENDSKSNGSIISYDTALNLIIMN